MRLSASPSSCNRPFGTRILSLAAPVLVLAAAGTCCRAQDAPLDGGQQAVRVKAKAFLSFKKLPAGGECEIVVLLTIQDGWHINANAVEKEYLIPTEMTVSSKLGTTLARISYPRGRMARVPGSQGPVPIYERQATVRGVLKVPAEAAGRLEEFRIQVRYQACNDHECEQPKHLKLVGKVPVGGDGERVEEANSNLFPRSR
jgi:Disulphide bond corrector protein DsbC